MPKTLPFVKSCEEEEEKKQRFSIKDYETAIHFSLLQYSVVDDKGHCSELFKCPLPVVFQHCFHTLEHEFREHEVLQGPPFITTHGYIAQFFVVEK